MHNERAQQKFFGFCWAGFLWGPVWAVSKKIWWGGIGFLPYAAFIILYFAKGPLLKLNWSAVILVLTLVQAVIHFLMGIFGYRFALEKGKSISLQDLKKTQKWWIISWLLFVLYIQLLNYWHFKPK